MPHSDHNSSPSPTPSFSHLPPFPDNVPTAPLLRISLAKLLAHDGPEIFRCWHACLTLGFFYLSLDGPSGTSLLSTSSSLFPLMETFFSLPVSEKIKFDFKSEGSYFGYKGYGEGIVDKQGTRDKNEFFNVSKDDLLGVGTRLPCPDVLAGEGERSVLKRYSEECHQVCSAVLGVLDERLPLKREVRGEGGLLGKHRLQGVSGDQVRFVRAPPQEMDEPGVALGEHTDFGSVTVLFNRLGGLQVRLPDGMDAVPPDSSCSGDEMSAAERKMCEDGWCYVRPLPGHCVVNLGDALVKFSKGALRSNIHRVVAPPGRQADCTRYSLVYFCRPEDDVVLKSLVEGEGVEKDEEEEVTAKEWILRRALGRREPGGWEKSVGTEEGSMRKGGMRA